MASNGFSIVIDVESLAASINNKIESNEVHLSQNNCIFKIPSILARHNAKAYIPNYFSFGPFHHNQEKFKLAEKIKIKYLKDLLNDSEVMLWECLNSIKEVERNARDCHAVNLDHISGDHFIEMMVIDGCFIIELLRKFVGEVLINDDDPIFSMSCMLQFLAHDLILLENQIPWLVLERLFEKTKKTSHWKSLLVIAQEFLRFLFQSDLKCLDPILFVNIKINHILDLQRWIFVLPSLQVDNYGKDKLSDIREWRPIPSATRLKESGVKFVGAKTNSILDIIFKNRILEIPAFVIDGTTETLFRNLISYEQCLPNCSTIFTSYAHLMDNLIDTIDDMETLCKKGIFYNGLSQEHATELFNNLYNDTFVNDNIYGLLSSEVNYQYRRWWPKWQAAYVQNYVTKPWAVAAQIYAIIIFILTFWQAYKSD